MANNFDFIAGWTLMGVGVLLVVLAGPAIGSVLSTPDAEGYANLAKLGSSMMLAGAGTLSLGAWILAAGSRARLQASQ